MRRLVAALPPAPGQHSDRDYEPDLQQQSQERGEAAKPAQEAAAEQHAEQASAEQSGEQPAHEARAIEEAAGRGGLWRARGGPVFGLARVRSWGLPVEGGGGGRRRG